MLFFMLNDPFFLVIPLVLPGALTPKTDGLKLSGMGGIAVLLFDSGKKRINSAANFASLMPIGGWQTNHRGINHLAPNRAVLRHHSLSKKMGTIHKSQPQFAADVASASRY
jgi:hypothetical protein